MHDPAISPAGATLSGAITRYAPALTWLSGKRVVSAVLLIFLACLGRAKAEGLVLPGNDLLPDSLRPVAATLTGTVTDRDGNSIVNARVMLALAGSASVEARTAQDGRFSFSGLPAGAFQIKVSAPGFATQQIAGDLHPGDAVILPATILIASSSSDIDVTATQADISQAQIQEAEKQRVLGFVPNFYVSYDSNPVPLNPRQKIELAYKTTLDPITFAFAGVIAGIQQGTNTYPSWGQDAPAYGKRYAAAYGTFLTGTLIANAILPIVLHQDPRYFVKGTGSKRSRVLYALANSVICKGDSMRWQPNYSSILGSLAASGISNFYYPAADRQGARLTFENAAIGIGGTAVGNLFQEFLVRKLTPHTPKQTSKASSQSTPVKP